MKLFLSLVFFLFCQSAFGQVLASISNGLSTCSISANSSNFRPDLPTFAFMSSFITTTTTEFCFVAINESTITSGLIGGTKFRDSLYNSKNYRLSTETSASLGTCGIFARESAFRSFGGSGSQQGFTLKSNTAGKACSLNYTAFLIADPNNPLGNKPVCPKLDLVLFNSVTKQILSSRIDIDPFSVSDSTTCAFGNPTPTSSCSLSVPSAANIAKTTPQALTGVGAQTKPVNFTISINCFNALSSIFTPQVLLSYGKPLVGTCQAENMASVEVAAKGVNAFILDDLGGTLCASNSNIGFLPLLFKLSTTKSVYSDSKTLSAVLVNSDTKNGAAPTPGIFTTTATFTMTFR